MELGELLLLVKTNPNDGTVEVIDEVEFVRYMTTDTEHFYPQAASSSSSTRPHPGLTGYVWFSENLMELSSNMGCSETSYLYDICSNFAGWDFDEHCPDRDNVILYAFMYASALNSDLWANLSIKGFTVRSYTTPRPILHINSLVDLSDRVTVAAHPVTEEPEARPLWLL